MDAVDYLGHSSTKAGMGDGMRAALNSVFFVGLFAFAQTAHAEFSEESVRAQLEAQGYKQITFSERDGQIHVSALRDRIRLNTVYDKATGNVVSDRVSQVDEDDDSGGSDSGNENAALSNEAKKTDIVSGADVETMMTNTDQSVQGDTASDNPTDISGAGGNATGQGVASDAGNDGHETREGQTR